MFKIVVKYSKRGLFFLGAMILCYFLLAVILSFISTDPEEVDCREEKEIFIATNGIHMDIIVPARTLTVEMQQKLGVSVADEYLAFGWGDRKFFLETPTWGDLKLCTAMRAFLIKSEAAMHLTTYYNQQSEWKKLSICDTQLNWLLIFINKTFERNADGEFIEIEDAGYTNYDKFYEARGNFNGIQTCNQWVNKGLKSAEIKTSIWSPFDFGVLYQIKK